MVFAGERYYKIYRIALTIIGLWPHRKPTISHIQTAFYFGIYFADVFVQLTKYITSPYNLIIIIQYLTYFLPTIYCFISYNSFYFNAKAIKQMLEHVKSDWNMLTDNNEIEILTKYTFIIYVLSLLIYMFTSLGIISLILLECSPIILDILLPMNVSRPRTTFFEFFIDEEEYFFFYVICETVAVMTAASTLVTTGTVLLAFGSHSCAQFKIASDLIHNLVTDRTLQIPASQRTHFMYRNICRAVHIHNRTMRFVRDMLNVFKIWYFFLILTGVASLSCNLFRLLNAVIQLNDINKILICLTSFGVHITYMFVGNLAGQAIIDYSIEISNATYNTLWYVAPLPIQKLLLIIQKSVRNQRLIIGGVYVANLEGFSTLITSAMSYFTVMYTMMTKNI